MTAVVFAVPTELPIPIVAPQIGVVWRGADGTSWDLGKGSGGVVAVTDGIQGLHFPPWSPYLEDAMTGQRRRGYRTLARPVKIPLLVFSAPGLEWLQRDVAFHKGLHPLNPGTLTVTAPIVKTDDGVQVAGGSRSVDLVTESDGGFAFPRDPVLAGWTQYDWSLTADLPLWRGDPISRVFKSSEQVPFWGGSEDDKNLWLSAGTTLSAASIPNPGDVEASSVITVMATTDATVVVEIDGGTLSLPVVPAGSTLVVHTDPEDPWAELDGVDVSGTVTTWDPRPVPPGSSVDIGLTMTGTGSVKVELTPLFFRAW